MDEKVIVAKFLLMSLMSRVFLLLKDEDMEKLKNAVMATNFGDSKDCQCAMRILAALDDYRREV